MTRFREAFCNVRIVLNIAVSALAFGLLPTISGLAQSSGESAASAAPSRLQSRAARHIARASSIGQTMGTAVPQTGPDETAPGSVVAMAPTRSSFLANWAPIEGATGYRLDVSTSPSFDTYASGYQSLDVGNVTSRIVAHLDAGTTYYYRVDAYGASGTGGTSLVMTATTTTGAGLVINPTFDSSITSNPNAAAIEAMITRTIAIFQSLLSDPITVEILYRFAATDPGGRTLDSGTVSESDYAVYSIPWVNFTSALVTDAKTSNDNTANASLPTSSLTPNVTPSSANGRALALDTPPAMFSNGRVGTGGQYDGIVTLNSQVPFQFTRPTLTSNYDAQRSTEHETDEVLGFGSHLGNSPPVTDLMPQDLFSWSAHGIRNYSAHGTRYFSIDAGSTYIVGFNQMASGDYGDWLSDTCPQSHPYVQNAFGCPGQSSDVSATSPEGVNLDVIGYDLVSTPPPASTLLGNISTRGLVGTGDNVLIGGFIITGTQPKEVIVRAIGPSLAVNGVPLAGRLLNPTLALNGPNGLIASNDNWQDDPVQAAEIIATGIPPTDNLESAIVATLPASPTGIGYTAVMSGVNNTTGIGLVEAYDLDRTVDSTLANISTRGLVQTGDNVMIGGLIALGTGSQKVLVRAIGPSLANVVPPVADVLADPVLELYDSNGTLLAMNDNWQDDPVQAAEIIATGIPPTNVKESAIVATLPASPTGIGYTAIVQGANGTTGVALVEIYALAP